MRLSFHIRSGIVGALVVIGGLGLVRSQVPLAAETAKGAEGPKLILPGDLFARNVFCEFAVYLMPGSQGAKPDEVLTKLLKGQPAYWSQVEKLPDTVQQPTIAGHLITDVPKSYQPPDLETLHYFGRGLSKEQAQDLQNAQQAYVIDCLYPGKDVWKSLRSATQLAGDVARECHGLVWDEATREVFTPEEWMKKQVADWTTDDMPDVSAQATMHAYKDGDFIRAVTLGMSKFGLPEIAVNRFVWSDDRQVGNLIVCLAQTLAEGTQLTKPGELDLEIKAIKNVEVRDRMTASLLPHAESVVKLKLQAGVPEKGDAENRLIDISFDRYPGADEHARQEAGLSALFGWQDQIKAIRHNDELLAASQRAKTKLPELRAAFQKGLAPGEYIQVKCPFDAPDRQREWMWVEVTSWKGDAIQGLLKNEPFYIHTLHGGQTVDVSEATVFDYIHSFPDGHEEGNETGPIIEKMEAAGH